MSDEEFLGNLDSGDAPGWKPQEGDVLVGSVSSLSTGWSDYKEGYYPIVTLTPELDKCSPNPPRSASYYDDEDKPLKDIEGTPAVAVHGFQFVLEDRFTSLKPEMGERIGIKVGPKVPTKDGKRSVQTYTVKMDRSEDIWSKLRGPRVPAPAQQQRQQELPVTELRNDDDIPF